MGHARALLGLTARRQQVEVALWWSKKGLSVRETEALVRQHESAAPAAAAPAPAVDPNIQRLEDDLSEKLGAPVAIEHAQARPRPAGRQLQQPRRAGRDFVAYCLKFRGLKVRLPDVEGGTRPPYNAPPLPGSLAVVSPPSTPQFASVRRQGLWVVVGQVLVALGGALIGYATRGQLASVSALIGGGIGAAATLVQVVVGLRSSAGQTPQAVVRGFYRGSAMKLAVTVLLFALALRGRHLAAAPLFVTYVATFLVYWLALARSFRSQAQRETMTSMEHRDQ